MEYGMVAKGAQSCIRIQKFEAGLQSEVNNNCL